MTDSSLRRPKTSIFDQTDPGWTEPVQESAAPDPEQVVTRPVGPPRRPKYSIFEETQAGVEPSPLLVAPPPPPTQPLKRPKNSIFDITLPGTEPFPPTGFEPTLQMPVMAPPVAEAPEISAPEAMKDEPREPLAAAPDEVQEAETPVEVMGVPTPEIAASEPEVVEEVAPVQEPEAALPTLQMPVMAPSESSAPESVAPEGTESKDDPLERLAAILAVALEPPKEPEIAPEVPEAVERVAQALAPEAALPTMQMDPDQALREVLQEAAGESLSEEALSHLHEQEPVAMPPVVVEAALPPAALAHHELEDFYDEGTAAEWNPRWAQIPGVVTPLPAPSPVSTAVPEPRLETPVESRRTLPWRWIGPALGVAAAVLLAVVLWPRDAAPAAARAVPPELQPYLAKAQAGDVGAMRMLGLRYVYGVASPMDREEGLRWLRKASLAGSKTAADELRALGAN